MNREIINDQDIEKVVGGSIVFNAEHTTCGRDRNDQYRVLDYGSVMDYIAENRFSMTERTMLSNMEAAGYLEKL